MDVFQLRGCISISLSVYSITTVVVPEYISNFKISTHAGGRSSVPETLNDVWRRVLGTGRLSLRELHEGDLRVNPFTGEPERYVK
jgi:hypothetical protein